jgi:chromosome segregation ATPase
MNGPARNDDEKLRQINAWDWQTGRIRGWAYAQSDLAAETVPTLLAALAAARDEVESLTRERDEMRKGSNFWRTAWTELFSTFSAVREEVESLTQQRDALKQGILDTVPRASKERDELLAEVESLTRQRAKWEDRAGESAWKCIESDRRVEVLTSALARLVDAIETEGVGVSSPVADPYVAARALIFLPELSEEEEEE